MQEDGVGDGTEEEMLKMGAELIRI